MKTLVAVAKDKFARGFDGSGRRVRDAYEIVEITEALSRSYASDAHLVTYVVRDASRQPRIKKAGLASMAGIVETTVFFCDVDNPAHAPWSDELVARARAEYDSIDVLRTCGIYHTAHGRRIMQPLKEPIPVSRVEPYLRHWLLSLEAAGLSVDWSCRDWTRHFRLPHVVRGGRAYRSPLVRLERMEPIALAPLPEEPPGEPKPRRTRRMSAPVAWTSDLPEQWEAKGTVIAKAIRDSVTQDWHDMYLALGGALLARRMPPEHLPALVRWIASAAGSVKPESHERSAEDTAKNYAAGLPATGLPTLRVRWPAVALAFEEVMANPIEAKIRAQAKSAAAPPPLSEATRALEEAIRRAPDGLTVVSAECGIGKTRAAMTVAAERAQKGRRLFTKTSISVDKHTLALQIAKGMGVPVRRVFGPLSVLREDGTKECRFADTAGPLVDGGQPMQWELCQGRGVERCEFYDTCRARDGVEGPPDARVTVGPHALLAELDATAGSTGLLVIDEPPAVLETLMLTRDDLSVARRRLDCFDGQFAAAMTPALDGFIAWLDLAEDGMSTEPMEALRQARPAPDAWAYAATSTAATDDPVADTVACARRALREDRRSQAPALQRSYIFAAKRSVKLATELGTASKVLGTIRRALMSKTPVAVRAEKRGVLFTSARPEIEAALRREGAVVVTDANAEVHLPVYEKIVGYAPHVHRFSAADGAPIARTLIRCATANRKHWFIGEEVNLQAITRALDVALQWARERADTRRVGLVTFQAVRAVLEAPGGPLGAWPGEIVLGHYGGLRGLDSMADVDALITLGDPWPNLGDAKADAAFLGLADWEARVEALARAELEQAHGRIRAIHRTRPGRALHLGSVLPSGYGWTSGEVEIREMPVGHTQPVSGMNPAELELAIQRLGGMASASRALRCDSKTLWRYCTGERPVPVSVVSRIPRTSMLGPNP